LGLECRNCASDSIEQLTYVPDGMVPGITSKVTDSCVHLITYPD
jgi:hypothetical protein